MKHVGITGQRGFIGSHLYNTLSLFPERYSIVPFEKSFFSDQQNLDHFVSQCDVIVHLAALNRHPDSTVIYETNVALTKQLAASIDRSRQQKKVIFSSSTQEDLQNDYGRSKKDAAEVLTSSVGNSGSIAISLTIPNVFGPFGKPFYNSVVATFCHQLTRGEVPVIKTDSTVNLIYVGELVHEIMCVIDSPESKSGKLIITPTSQVTVSKLLATLTSFRDTYMVTGAIPAFESRFDINLFNTFRSYIPLREYFPFKLKKNTDARGSFVEIVRLNVGGQVSFSTTVPRITRGNHFHTRKIERFCVIKGEATIEMRKIGTQEVITFEVNGNEPSFVDMPVWFTHNITNVGEEELLTIFWINEFFDPADPDTYFEMV